ncbi:response regulator transcription factor [Actinomadura parmotrematis]|uniref:Response regulator transcription factor n=1 Tax=Actinomadura parmotrematis TaxID=2864039 RepID=A0ABS7G160_9ACTN|nr:response regulator transcription factor [Actinomadura parmotrematis]MBW8486448.1 response regulator transcription factor [Actinomadura parmotrematis]
MTWTRTRDGTRIVNGTCQPPAARQIVLVIGEWAALEGERARAGAPRIGPDGCRMHGSLIFHGGPDAAEPSARLRAVQPDWLLVSWGQSDEDELLKAVGQWRLRLPGARLAMLGSQQDRQRAESWIRRGCTVYLSEASTIERVLGTLLAASRLDLQVFDHSLYLRWQRSMPETPTLTARQREVLRLIASGNTNAEIARELYLTQHTIEFHIRHLLQKLGVRNRTEAAERARVVGLL